MSGRRVVAGAAVALACLAAAPSVSGALGAVPPARVQGRFTMRTVITAAVNVRGEHRGERLTRTWRVRPGGCVGNVCQVLHVRRTRGQGRRLWLTLHRRSGGGYVGYGRFFVALSCHGRVIERGAVAPYAIRLRVTAARSVGGVRFARRLAASYVNRRRIDRTRCAFAPSYDAARYLGRLRGGLPSPPRPAFTATVSAGGLVSFLDASAKGQGPGRRIIAWRWNFGDPLSGPANVSTLQSPAHQFTAPGSYVVRLTATDHAGLRATVAQTVMVPAPVPAALSDPSSSVGNNAHLARVTSLSSRLIAPSPAPGTARRRARRAAGAAA